MEYDTIKIDKEHITTAMESLRCQSDREIQEQKQNENTLRKDIERLAKENSSLENMNTKTKDEASMGYIIYF